MSSQLIGARTGDSEDLAFFDGEDSLTHPRGYSTDRVERLETFANDVDRALKSSMPSGPNPYTAVHALLLRWSEDDLGVQAEVSELHRVFETRFNYDVEEWQIPSLNSTRALQRKLYDFQDAHQSETELLIVYYGGHAKEDSRRGRSIWQANGRSDSPHLHWSPVQSVLETAVPHILIILDCCYAATAARDTTEGTTKEILAACGRENPTLGVGQRSFTSALIEEMQALDGAPFTAVMLHARLATMRWRLAFTPFYALLSEHGGPSITICPCPISAESDHLPVEPAVTEPLQDRQTSIIAETRVLLSVSVVEDASHDVSQWVSWLTTATPWDVKKVDVQVHSVFKSYSTLIVVSVPTTVWDRLPERPAYRFVGFVRSGDCFQAAKSSTTSMINQRPKRQRTDPVAQIPSEIQRLTSPFSVSAAPASPSVAAPQPEEGPNLNTHRHSAPPQSWSSEMDEQLLRARQQGLSWQPIASQYFPDKTANDCLKRHERLREGEDNADNRKGAEIEIPAKAYDEVKEQMWKLLADRVGEKWQTVEAKCIMGDGLKALVKAASRQYARSNQSSEDSGIGHEA